MEVHAEKKITTWPRGAQEGRGRPYPIQKEGQTLVDVLLGVHSDGVVVLVHPAVAPDKEIFEGLHVLLLESNHQLIVESEHDELRAEQEGGERERDSFLVLEVQNAGSIPLSW